MKMRIYLDNCCYNRPYDDQTQIRISLESQAKLHVQEQIKEGEHELVSSYMLVYENSKNRVEAKRAAIKRFVEDNTVIFIDESKSQEAETIAKEVQKTGVKSADSIHAACAILANCDYFLTTDDRLLKYKNENLKVVNPTEFIRLTEGGDKNE